MSDPIAVVPVLVGAVAYLIGYWRGRKDAMKNFNSMTSPWIAMLREATERKASLLVCGQPYVAAEWPERETMH